MPIEISFVDGDEFILVVCRGKVTFKEIKAANGKGFDLAAEHRVFRFLADTRLVEPVIGPYEIYYIPDLYASMGLPRSTMIAVVAERGSANYENYRFFETVCRNNGYHYVETFYSIEAAKDWLANSRPPEASSR